MEQKIKPSRERYLKVLREEANKMGVSTYIAGYTRCKEYPYYLVRWRAWARLKEINPNYSLPGIAYAARIDGVPFDHSSVIHALRRIKEIDSTREMDA